ncbi:MULTISPECIES: substrate-binding domain-containing protein [Ensifer]|jgi:ribose transport system substrate-binding protein|nr:sugar ABC transporter substrate-binding protein [Ensifer sp. Root1298]KQX83686.1 sugar ABC transporter substrate-binding protein [Ensifer sp. Root1312]KRC20031.1 sugar ABC transporter substrate-binding protein [Ensifer sp. Root74]KRD63278.1 sugar ABC transporter substrate-binding protein [Ensifer sp. Root954]
MSYHFRKPTRALALATALLASVCITHSAYAIDISQKISEIEKNPAPGPNGEPATLASDLKLTAEEVEQIKAKHAKAAIVMHYTASDWAKAQMAGQKKALDELGVEIVAVTDAGYRAEQQVADIESVMALKPDIMISVPAEQSATAAAYKKAAAAGIKIVFLDQTGAGMQAGKDYVSLVSSDNRGMGKVAALLMAKALEGKGEVGLIPHASDLFATKERVVGFKEAIKDFPDIKVVEESGVGGPNFAGEAERVASAMLTAHPTLNGIWAVWDVPTEGVLSAARSVGASTDLVITTCDLGVNISLDMAKKGYVKGTGSQRPYGAGYAEGILAGYALLGKEAPPYVVLPALAVTRDNLLEAWPLSNGDQAPAILTSAMN